LHAPQAAMPNSPPLHNPVIIRSHAKIRALPDLP
jgi:hypothetical protein